MGIDASMTIFGLLPITLARIYFFLTRPCEAYWETWLAMSVSFGKADVDV
jgi:hypothetical protein